MEHNSDERFEIMVRSAKTNDADYAAACVNAAFSRYIDRMARPPGPMMADFPALIAAGRVWLAEIDATIVGVLVQYETKDGFYIDTVAAHPIFQGKGVGRALLVFAEQEAQRRGYQSIYLCTNAKMTENQVFYPRIGYVEYDRKHDEGYDRVFCRKQL